MTAGDQAGTVAKAIRGMGLPKWRQARQSEIDCNRIDTAYRATRTAIEKMPGDPWLSLAAVAVLLNCVETTAWNWFDKFKSDPRYENGRDFRSVVDPVAQPGSNKQRFGLKNDRWEYRRGAVMEFWETRERKETSHPRRKHTLKSPTQRLAEEVNQLHGEVDQLHGEVEQLQKLVRAHLPFLTKDGKVFDSAGLPQAPVPDIKAFLTGGGTVEFMTLGEALQEREWFGYGYREAWAALWKDTLTRAIANSDKMALLSVPVARKGGRERRSRA